MKSKKYIIFLSLLVAVLGLSGAANANNSQMEETNKRVVARNQAERQKAIDLGCTVAREVKNLTALNCKDSVAQNLGLTEDIKVFAQKFSDITDAKKGGPNNPPPSSPPAGPLEQIGADIVHTAWNTGQGRRVVILDSGYNYMHQELSSSYLGGYDFVNNDNDPMDDHGHGSHVAGIVTGDGIDSRAKGVAPDTGVIAGKVLAQDGWGYFTDIIAGIYWAVNGPDGIYGTGDDFAPDAISMSIGTSAPYLYKGYCNNAYPELTNAIKYATDKNVPVVVAAGNSGRSGVSIPGCISYSTTVGAVDKWDKVANFSGRGGAVDISAPGVEITSSVLGNSYGIWSGTSMATPMVTGVIALIKHVHQDETQSQVENRLFSSAKDLGKFGKDNEYGWGRVVANLAVQ